MARDRSAERTLRVRAARLQKRLHRHSGSIQIAARDRLDHAAMVREISYVIAQHRDQKGEVHADRMQDGGQEPVVGGTRCRKVEAQVGLDLRVNRKLMLPVSACARRG